MSEMPDTRFCSIPKYKPLAEKQQEAVWEAAKLLQSKIGFVDTPRLRKEINKWVEAKRLEAMKNMDERIAKIQKLIAEVEKALEEGGIEKAKEVCRNTRGPVASIYYQGLLHYDQGIDVVEKNIVSYGSVQNSELESGLSWISLFIAIAPSLGFLGTVIGMIQAFDAIQAAGDISPNVVAGGMKVALITTVAGLIVAMILQVFYNYILAKIENITIDMEDSTISLVDVLTKYGQKK